MFRPVALLLALTLASTAAAQGKNLLFYGNSYSFFSWGYGVPELVQQIAVAAGHPSPTFVAALVGGSDLQFHATDPNQVATISTSLALGQTWDHVVIQGHSLEATYAIGYNPAQFRNNAVAVMGNVRAHSPAVTAVLYQTWARAHGHIWYPSAWAHPTVMHDLVRGNYRLAASDIDAAFGAGAADVAAVGDAVALLEWDPSWYDPDKSHPGPAMTLLAAMCIYTTIYGQTVCEIDPGFGVPSPLALSLAGQGLGAAEWNLLAGLADRSAAPATRQFPGSGDHLLLETATDQAPPTACPSNRMTTGTLVQLQLRSMNGYYDAAPGWLLVDLFPTGAPPGPSTLYHEIAVDLGSMAILMTAPSLTSPLTFTIPMPFSWPGSSVLVQGLAWGPSGETGNPWFTTTDGHVFEFY